MHPSKRYGGGGGGYQGGSRLARIPSEDQLGHYTPSESRLGDNGGADLRTLNTTDQFVALSLGDGPND